MKINKILALILCICLVATLAGCGAEKNTGATQDVNKINNDTEVSSDVSIATKDKEEKEIVQDEVVSETTIVLDGNTAKFNGADVEEFDYTFSISPDMKEPSYTGTEPTEGLDMYIAHDIVYYPEIDESAFTKERYDDETEWVTHYTVDGLTDYLFGTLPVLGNELPTEMMHSAEEAYNNPVLHINKAGTYELTGTWNGQIYINLGKDAKEDESQRVILILNNVDIACTVGPAILFKNVYEADGAWEDSETHNSHININSENAGAVVIIADDSQNSVEGANVYRLLKPEYKTEGSTVQKKLYKTDGAFYSCESMVVDGQTKDNGMLTITATTFEGLDTELHLVIDGGNTYIYSADDGINVNEDDVSVFMMNDGTLHIFAGLGAEGDGIDSNGYIVVNGGMLYSVASPISDNGLDSGSGTEINGGVVVALGSNMFQGSYSVYIDGEQQYTNREGFGAGGTGFGQGGGFNPFGNGERPEMPDNFNGENPPDGFTGEMREPPNGFNGEQPGELPAGDMKAPNS